jgi:hypothetical protein
MGTRSLITCCAGRRTADHEDSMADPAASTAASPETADYGSRPSGAGDERDRFSLEELAVVLSHYDLGVIEAVRAARGARRSS